MTNKLFCLFLLKVCCACNDTRGVNDHYVQSIYRINKGDSSLVETRTIIGEQILEAKFHHGERVSVRDTFIYRDTNLMTKTRYTDSCKWFATTEYLYSGELLKVKKTNTKKRSVLNYYDYNKNGKVIKDKNIILDKQAGDSIIFENTIRYEYDFDRSIAKRFNQEGQLHSYIESYLDSKGRLIKENYYDYRGVNAYSINYTWNNKNIIRKEKEDGQNKLLSKEIIRYRKSRPIKKIVYEKEKIVYKYVYSEM